MDQKALACPHKESRKGQPELPSDYNHCDSMDGAQ